MRCAPSGASPSTSRPRCSGIGARARGRAPAPAGVQCRPPLAHVRNRIRSALQTLLRPGREVAMAPLGGTASAEIDAPLQEVWAVVEDVLSAPDWQGGLDRMTALEHDADGRPTLVETENDIKVRR